VPGRGSYARDGGGVLISQAIHTLDLMLSLTGPVTEVQAMVATTGFHRMEAEDLVCAGLRFAKRGGGPAVRHHGELSRGGVRRSRCTVPMARRIWRPGVLRLDWQDGRSEVLGARPRPRARGRTRWPSPRTGTAFVIEDFAEALREGRPPLVPGRAALKVHAG
jgi:UDP-N-acetyl-2-amino-2-deoxyglucuronate dehydrogenase